MTDRESFANKLTGTIFDIKNFALKKIGKTGIQRMKILFIF